MVKKAPESKASKREKIAKSQSKQKKKWSSGTTKESSKRLAIIDDQLFSKIEKDTQNMKIITPATLSDRYNLNLYLCNNILSALEQKNVIHKLHGGKYKIYGGGKYVKAKEIIVEVEDEGDWNEEEWAEEVAAEEGPMHIGSFIVQVVGVIVMLVVFVLAIVFISVAINTVKKDGNGVDNGDGRRIRRNRNGNGNSNSNGN